MLQAAGTLSPAVCRRLLVPTGTLVQISGDSGGRWIGAVDRLVRARLLAPFVSQTLVVSFTVTPSADDRRR